MNSLKKEAGTECNSAVILTCGENTLSMKTLPVALSSVTTPLTNNFSGVFST
ncbi:Uncharacterised protein [Chlamydia abortus]|nr:Uncharacterised protein [Chlamydia abortus]